MRRIAVLDAPSNLGLRPPTATSVPGCAKAPGALRDHGLLGALGARDAGCLTPPRYDPGDWRPGDGVAHAKQIAAYSRALAGRIGAILDAGEFPVVLGGDCSILLGSGVAMHRLGESIGGHIGLVFVDGHSDFRHPGNASYVGAAAGEDLALATGRGQTDLASIEGRRPYFRDIDVVVLGIRAQDEYRLDLQAAGIVTRPVPALRAEGAARSAQWARDQLSDCAGYWVHIDVDVLDPAVMPAVDAPSPGGIAFPELELLLAGLVESPHCLGVEITVFDPDYDPDGSYAAEITTAVAAGLAAARTADHRADLDAARRDMESDEEPPAGVPAAAPAATPFARLAAVPSVEPAAVLRPVAAALRPVAAGGVASASTSDISEMSAEVGDGEPGAAESADGVLPSSETIDDAADQAAAAEDPREVGELVVDEADDVSAEVAAAETDAAAAAVADADADTDAAAVADADAGEPDEAAADVSRAASPEGAGDIGVERPRRRGKGRGEVVQLRPRPLGLAPLLDSDPIPATRPGMLRPRGPESGESGFSLPVQRPAFDANSAEATTPDAG